MWLSLLPFGLGSWAPVLAGRRYGVRWWTALGLFWPAVLLGGFILSANERAGHNAAAGLMILLAWGGGIITSFAIRSHHRSRRMSGVLASPGADRVVLPPDANAGAGAQQALTGRRDRWPWVSLLPLGTGSWVPILAAVRCRVWWWALPGLLGGTATVFGFGLISAASSPDGTNRSQAAVGALLLIAAWLGGIAASFAIRPAYDTRRGLPPRDQPAWPRPSARSRQWSVRYALIAYAVTFVGANVLGLGLRYVVGVHFQVGASVLLVDAALLAGLVPLRRQRGLSLEDLGLRRTPSARSLWLVLLAFLAYITLTALWALAFLPHSATRAARDLSGAHQPSTFEIVLAVVAISASAPIVEEIFFRGLLYRSLRNRLPILQAALAAGLLFGLVHITGYPLITLPVKAAFGVIACLLYERTGSLLPGMALHSFVDASVVDIALTGNDLIVLIVSGALAIVCLLRAAVLRVFRAQRREPAPDSV